MQEPTPSAANDAGLPPMPSPERIQALLFDAARLGRIDVIPALIQGGADIAATDAKGYSALILASYNGQEEATALLLACGAPVDQGDAARGNTALMGVAFKGYSVIAKLLLDAGADPHARNLSGQTALMMASLFGHYAIVNMLLALGADPYAIDGAGNSAMSVAADQGNVMMTDHLSAYAHRSPATLGAVRDAD